MIETAISYFEAGLCVLPANVSSKRPALSSWSEFRTRRPSEEEVRTMFANANAICIVTGPVSGNLELLDFDLQGELFEAWRALVDEEMPGLFDRLVVERSQSGGRHVVYRCEEAIPGNLKLARRRHTFESDAEVTIAGKTYRPRPVGDHFEVTLTLIETRGDGGLFLCAPSPGYELIQGSLTAVPVLTDDERDVLIGAAGALTEVLPPEPVEPVLPTVASQGRPGDDYNQRGDVHRLLRQHGWQLARRDEAGEYWRRPGKSHGWSASMRNGFFHVFSTNAEPFEPDRPYRPFAIYTLLEHGGDYSAAASELRTQGYGQPAFETAGVDISHLMSPALSPLAASEETYPDPGPIPQELLRIPGFVSDVMDHTLSTAPYPNPALAFCGALSLLAVLAGRKVRDEGDNRTNLYLLALAHSAAGKDHPRKVNTTIMHRIGQSNALGDKFASGEGIQDSLIQTPAMLFQTDEIDGLLQSINTQDARHDSIMATLLTMYSSASSIYPMRRKASREAPRTIDQPNLVLFGTAIPRHFYEALSGRMLTNGFFARMLVVESGRRGRGQEPRIIDPPESVIEMARWWTQFNPGGGNLESQFPNPRIVPADDEARSLLSEARLTCEREYSRAETRTDETAMAILGRFSEQARKLALLYAVSANHQEPRIDAAAVRWATAFMMHQTRRMLFMAHDHVAESTFHADCLKLIRKLREAPGWEISHSALLKRMKLNARTFGELVSTLVQQGDVEVVTEETSGRTHRSYRLRTGESVAAGAAS